MRPLSRLSQAQVPGFAKPILPSSPEYRIGVGHCLLGLVRIDIVTSYVVLVVLVPLELISILHCRILVYTIVYTQVPNALNNSADFVPPLRYFAL